MEETFGCEFELFIEFTGLISWCRGASIGWHSDDNRLYLKQRDFSAVCYLNSYAKDFKGGLFRFQSGEPSTVSPSAGDVIMYTADDRNVHSVDEVTDGERLTLAMWFTRDSSHDEDSKLVSRLSQCASSHEFPLPLPASTNMYWFSPHQHANGFDICVARLHLLGFDIVSLQDEDRSLDVSDQQLVGPIQLAKGRELLTREFTNVLHALQVVQFCRWKAFELKTSSKVGYDAVEEVKAMSQPQLETVNALNAVFLPDKGLVTTTFGYICSSGEEKDSLNLADIASGVTCWEEYTCKLLKELLSSLPQWETYQTIHKVASD